MKKRTTNAISRAELARRMKAQGKEILDDNRRADEARMSKEERKIYEKKRKR